MNYKDLSPGKNVPTDVNALIEIGKNEGSVKYEFDRTSGAIVVDRLRDSFMRYPINYGCIPQTLSDDGDPLDILVFCEDSIQTGTVIPACPVGILIMEDEKGHDVKIIAVPADRLTEAFMHIQDVADLPEADRKKIEHFFKHYKDLDSTGGRWSTTSGWQGVAVAHQYIDKAIAAGSAAPPRPKP
jgi:inorganic pyrophosphatase